MIGFAGSSAAALQYSYAPNLFDAEPYYDSSSEIEPGDSGFSFRILSGGKVEGYSWIFLGNPGDDSAGFERHYFRGHTIGEPILRAYADPREIADRTQGLVIVPSSRQAFIRMKSSEGIVISGVFQSSLEPNTTKYPGYPPVGRLHIRFHGTISNPAILGFKNKHLTLMRTFYLNKDYLRDNNWWN